MRRRRSAPINDRQWGRPTALGSRIPLASLIQALAVAEYLSFYRAANALGVSQSSVSARIKGLEQELGILLFERNTRGVRLTEAGRLFVEAVSAGVDQLDRAVKTAGMAAHGECGRLRIGVHALIPRSFLAELIERYREGHPGIDVEITEGTARDTVMQLRADRLDIVFVAGTPELPDCHSRRMWTEPLVAALPERHRLAGQPAVTWADLAGETFLVRHGGTGPQVHDHIVLRLAGRWPASSIQRFDVERGTLLSMVGQGFGITIFGAATSLLPSSGVVFVPFADEPEPVPFSAVWSPFNQSATLRNLLDLANEMDRADPAGLSRRDSFRQAAHL
ncbi:LysR family transcriptional regulator [Consotaella salsifontis]|uniref:Transcriptional regulator, LysR family n=1 Tax=Consotaella salsifontis TaxID=1365950 RepID=A0A1T4Q5B8_9HYPH|nr:LysR family transcriptional regulator [Consotaella salsifontis]SJZ98962.1 transcriptional regulator, LysR family [Consotaella salsifontis]